MKFAFKLFFRVGCESISLNELLKLESKLGFIHFFPSTVCKYIYFPFNLLLFAADKDCFLNPLSSMCLCVLYVNLAIVDLYKKESI